ncbi:MAG: hypothetical protein A3J72_01890 [Nitrospirae bacterium RIFCSPHIGHO2_02_FULL_40_19]|nr:MAG: hypothetical protein A3J72_01890 [Nitrospirae bacterium RIFCSPHIGHO2_02_FULL_40_19]
MELNIGSNIIRNTSGVLSVEEKEQISLEIGERDDQLLLTMDIYDSKGNHIAKLRRNAWVFNDKDRFEVTTIPASLKLIDKESGDIVVEANVVEKDRIQILQGRFYTHGGHLLEITPQFWRIAGGITMSGNVIDSCGGAVAIR